MSEESVDKSPEALGAVIALMLFLCCANTAKYKQQPQEPTKIPTKILLKITLAIFQVPLSSQTII